MCINVLLFIDSDQDDIYSLTVLASQHFLGKIKIIGIVCDDGFLSFPQNILVVDYWFKNIIKLEGIEIYKGMNRTNYLKQQRDYPKEWVDSFIERLKINFDYNPSIIPEYKTIDELLKKINKFSKKSISVLTTGNLTTFSYLLKNNISIKNKFNKIYSMIGNYKVSGNTIPAIYSEPNIVPDSEYNAYIDTDSFANTINYAKINIVPLDCTNYAPLNSKTILDLTKIGNIYYEKSNNIFLKNVYNIFIKLLNSVLLGPDTDLYLWDLVSTMLFLNKKLNQKYITRNININWTGRIIKNNKSINKCKIYNYIDYSKLILEINNCIFGYK